MEDKDEASKAFLKEISELKKENDKLKEGIRWKKFYQDSYVAQASAEAGEYANRIQTLEPALVNLKEKTGFKSGLQGMESEGKKPSGDVEEETIIPKEKLEDEDEQKNKDTKMWDDERDRLKQDKEDVPKRTKEGKPDQDDRELQGTIDATPEAHSRNTPDVLALTPDATLLFGNTGPERPVALTPAQSEDSTSNISPQSLIANIQSAPLTPNNRLTCLKRRTSWIECIITHPSPRLPSILLAQMPLASRCPTPATLPTTIPAKRHLCAILSVLRWIPWMFR